MLISLEGPGVNSFLAACSGGDSAKSRVLLKVNKDTNLSVKLLPPHCAPRRSAFLVNWVRTASAGSDVLLHRMVHYVIVSCLNVGMKVDSTSKLFAKKSGNYSKHCYVSFITPRMPVHFGNLNKKNHLLVSGATHFNRESNHIRWAPI